MRVSSVVKGIMCLTGNYGWLPLVVAGLAIIFPARSTAYTLEYSKSNQDWEESRKKLNDDFTVQSFEYQKSVPEVTDNTRLIVNSEARGDHSVALTQSWELAEGVDLEHRAQVGIGNAASSQNLIHSLRDPALEETLTQRHTSRLTVQPTKWSRISIANDFQFKKREQSLTESQSRNSSIKGHLKLSRQLEIDPYIQQNQKRTFNNRESTRDTLGMNMTYKMSRYTTLQPKLSTMTQYDDIGRASMRENVYLGVRQVLYRKYLNWEVSPEYTRQTRDWDDDYQMESYGLDNALTWTPLRRLTIKSGSKLLQQDFLHNDESHWRQLVYSEVSHRPLQKMKLRVRGEYDISEKDREVDQFRDTTSKMNVLAEISHQPMDEIALKVRGSYRQEVRERYSDETRISNSQLAFAFRPEYRISDAFTTGAEYRYQYRDRGNASNSLPQEEQIFMVNIMGTF